MQGYLWENFDLLCATVLPVDGAFLHVSVDRNLLIFG